MATRADIEIAVKGIRKLEEAKKQIRDLNKEINKSNKQITKQAEKDGVLKKGNKTSVGAASQVRSINTLNKNLAKATRNFNRVALGTDDAAKAAIQLKKAQDALNVAYAQQNDLLGKNVQAQGAFSRISDRQSRNAEGQRTRMNNPLVRGISKIPGLNPTKGFDTQSALISGAFPLLFGQGPVGAAAGALGGGIGGMFGGMGGFAGGIAATAVVQQIQSFLDSASKLGQALSPLVQDVTAVTTALGLQGSTQEAQLKRIEETQGKTAAFNAAMKIMAGRITQDGVDKLKNFGDNTRLLGEQFTIALTKLQAFAAGVANFVIRLTGLQDALKEREATRIVSDAAAMGDTTAQKLVKRRESAEKLGGQGGEAARKKNLLDQIKLEERIFAIQQKVSTEVGQMTEKSSNLLLEKEKELALNNRVAEIMKTGINKELATSLAEVEQIFDAEEKILKEKQKQTKAAFEKAIIETNDKDLQRELQLKYDEITKQLHQHNINREKGLDLTKKTANETDKVTEAFQRLNETIRNDIKEGIKGLIKGTSTLGDLLNNVADRFLDLALNQALFGSAAGEFKKGAGGGIFGAIAGMFANGGRPPVGKPSIVGEKGPELFVPRSSGTIVPNNKLGGGGSTSVVVNVDASGTDVQGDDSQAKELGTLISVAVQGELIKQQRPGGLLSSLR